MQAVGATFLANARTAFSVWAPRARAVELHLTSPIDQMVPMQACERGYHQVVVPEAGPGTRYFFRVDGRELPDPASRFQPEGVHGPSEVVDPAFVWSDHRWFGLPLREYVLYELHTGTFTPEGTYDAVIPHLDELRDLGVTVIELMPVAQFPGERNWGYDGVYPYAPQASYGGPEGLKRLVNACHARGMGMCLDVVYNHLGPEGSYVEEFGPYFTDTYTTPWGKAMNFDGPDSDEVRAFFIGNALYWFEEFHIDALRLDAVHAILDTSALPFLEELALATSDLSERLNRRLHLIAESADNDARIIAPRELGGYGLDAQWNDDFHHALHALVTGERAGYYADYGDLRHLARAYADGFVYQGEHSVFRRRRHGRSSRHRGAQRFVVFTRNHDQIGNRMLGERPTVRLSFEELKLTAAVMLLSPYIPLLFMGEDYAETAPFQYFVSHSDPDLIEAVRRGRAEEFSGFGWEGAPPDPQAEEAFLASKIDRSLREKGHHATMWSYYTELLRLRRTVPALAEAGKDELDVSYDERAGILAVRRWVRGDETLAVFHFGATDLTAPFPEARGRWRLILDSADDVWDGPGSKAPRSLGDPETAEVTLRARSAVAYRRQGLSDVEVI